MIKLLTVMGSVIVMLGTSGCLTGEANARIALEAYKEFQSQPHEIESFVMVAPKGGTITITGIQELRVKNAAIARHAMPQNPTFATEVVHGVVDVMKFGVQGAVLGAAFDASSKSPLVVEQPAPIVIEKEVLISAP